MFAIAESAKRKLNIGKGDGPPLGFVSLLLIPNAASLTMLMSGWLDVQAMRLNHLESLAMDHRDSVRQLEWAVREAGVRREQLELSLLSTDDERAIAYRRVQFARGLESIGDLHSNGQKTFDLQRAILYHMF